MRLVWSKLSKYTVTVILSQCYFWTKVNFAVPELMAVFLPYLITS